MMAVLAEGEKKKPFISKGFQSCCLCKHMMDGAEDGNRIFSINRVLMLLGPHYTPKNAPKFAPHSLTQSVKNISKCWPNPSIMYLDQSRPSAHPDAPHRSSYCYAVVRSMAMTDNGPKRLRDACNHNNKAPYYYGNTL